MKNVPFLSLIAACLVYAGTGLAQTDSADHSAHHPDGAPETVKSPEEPSKSNSDGGSMKMGDMKGMMHKCMEMHKDQKMCEHETMENCQANMGQNECDKMMKKAKVAPKKS